MLKYKYIVVHYDEIGIKKKNRPFFENRLIEDLKTKFPIFNVCRRYGRVICKINSKDVDYEKINKILKITPGIANFSYALRSKLDLEDIASKTLELINISKEFNSFRVITKRSNKNFKMNSQEINKEIGAVVLNKFKNKKVDLENADLDINIEIGEKDVFIYSNKYYGIGGLANKSSGNLLCSLSGGIDSPVAAFMLMKRGCRVIFVHIQNNTLTNNKLEEKIKNLVKKLTRVQASCKLYIVPFSNLQKELILSVSAEYRMIIYRIFMTKILNKIAIKEKAKGIITGDSIGQVASQTIENINCIYNFAKLPIFSPLIALNKNQIIDIAKKIGTYNLSIQPYPDCCSFMIAKHPQTKAKLEDVNKILENIKNKEELIKESINKSKIYTYKYKF
jgi:thiamine biosynthesis protein ThiI